jgi:hypothetical protein
MKKVLLTRTETGDFGTFGSLLTDNGFYCRSGELPWRDNQSNFSCIPAGVYTCTWRLSAGHGYCYHVEGVTGRCGIEIHAANFMGDVSKGLKCELLGCIAPGFSVGDIDGQRAVLASRKALTRLEDALDRLAFELTIEKGF